MDPLFLLILAIYFISSIALIPYPLNLVYLALKSRNYLDAKPLTYFSSENLPTVAIHVPVYNESDVIISTLDTIMHIDYPRSKLQVMILDDSTDTTSVLLDDFVATKSKDLNVVIMRRSDRSGYKAGALALAAKQTTAEYIVIFDADCKVPSNFLQETIHYFNDPNVGAIQTRWDHSNMHYSLFTLAMSIGLDGHFYVEKLGRMRTNAFLAFNGTGGIWRRETILDIGNWSSKTLAEDLDIAFRAQLKNKNVLYLHHVGVQQEIAPTLKLWGIQQTRWSRGFAQNLRLHLREVLTGQHTKNRFQGALQLTAYLIPFFLLINIVSSSALLFFQDFNNVKYLLVYFGSALGIVSVSGLIAYSVAIKRAKRPMWHILLIPLFLFWGLSLIIRIFNGVLLGFLKYGGEFKRTPKFDLYKDQAHQLKTVIKMPLDTTVFIEFIFLLFVGVATIWTFKIGPEMIFATLFYIYVFLSILLMLLSNLAHFIASK